MPFVTEEIWQQLRPHLTDADGGKGEGEALIVAAYPRHAEAWQNTDAERAFGTVQDVVRGIRQIRAEKSVDAGRWVEAYIVDRDGEPALTERAAVIETLARSRPLHIVTSRDATPDEQTVTQILDRAEIVLPLGSLVDLDAERTRLTKEIDESETHLKRVEGKLANEGFRSKAPAQIVAQEEQKRDEVAARIAGLRERLAELP
jgi:valyl-tRNA synthetase